jgi:hypothetical protein
MVMVLAPKKKGPATPVAAKPKAEKSAEPKPKKVAAKPAAASGT